MSVNGFEKTARPSGEPELDALAVFNRPEADIRAFMTKAYRYSDITNLRVLVDLLESRLHDIGDEDAIQYGQVNDMLRRAVGARDLLKEELGELEGMLPDEWAETLIRSILEEMEEDQQTNPRDTSDDSTEQKSRFENISVEHLSTLIQSALEKMMATHHFDSQFHNLGRVLKDLQKEIDTRLKSADLPDSEVALLLEAKSKADVAVEEYDTTVLKYPQSVPSDLET